MTERITDAELAAIEARANAATPGKWELCDQDLSVWDMREWRQVAHIQSHPGAGMRHDWDVLRANAEFIAHAREDVPALLAEVRRMRAEREMWRQEYCDMRNRM